MFKIAIVRVGFPLLAFAENTAFATAKPHTKNKETPVPIIPPWINDANCSALKFVFPASFALLRPSIMASLTAGTDPTTMQAIALVK